MTDSSASDSEVKIFPPDKSLLAKIGTANLDEVFLEGSTKAAQEVIKNSASDFTKETLDEIDRLGDLFQALAKDQHDIPATLKSVIDTAFSIKANAGLAGYELISALAKSLYLYCEAQQGKTFSQKTHDIIEWHITSIHQMVKLNVKGKGGTMGETIMAELEKLAAQIG